MLLKPMNDIVGPGDMRRGQTRIWEEVFEVEKTRCEHGEVKKN